MISNRASMNKINVFRLGFLAFFLFSSAGFAADEPVKQLQAFLKASKSLTADFKQVLINEAGDPYQTSYGVFLPAATREISLGLFKTLSATNCLHFRKSLVL